MITRVSLLANVTRMNDRRFGQLSADTGNVSFLLSIPGRVESASRPLELPPTTPIRVLLVDDHALFRIGLRQLMEQEGFSVVDADTAPTALRRSAGWAPDVVVMGVNRPAACDAETIAVLGGTVPSAAVLVLALVIDDAHVLRAARAGAVSYLIKDAELHEIVAGIRATACGHSALSPRAARVVVDRVRTNESGARALGSDVCALSERERAVLSLLAAGCDNSQIGARLFVSRSTV